MEAEVRKKYVKTPPSVQQQTTPLSPSPSPIPHHQLSPPKDHTSPQQNSPTPSLNNPQPQSPSQTQPPPSPPPQSLQPETEQDQPQNDPISPKTSPIITDPSTKQTTTPSSPTPIFANVLSSLEKESLQEQEAEKEKKKDADKSTSAPTFVAGASEEIPTVTIIPSSREATIQLVLQELADKKREDLAKNPPSADVSPSANKTPIVKKRTYKMADLVHGDAVASETASTPEKSDGSAAGIETPTSKGQPKTKKMRVKHTIPVRSSFRLRSGAKK